MRLKLLNKLSQMSGYSPNSKNEFFRITDRILISAISDLYMQRKSKNKSTHNIDRNDTTAYLDLV